MSDAKKYSVKEYIKEKLSRGGSYLFLMLFQEHCKRQKIKDKLTFEEWDALLDDFGTQPTKDVFDMYDPFE